MNWFLSFFIQQSSVGSAVANQLLLPSTLCFETHVAPPSHFKLLPFIATNRTYTLLSLPTRVIWRLIAFNTCVFVVWDEFGSCNGDSIIVVTSFPLFPGSVASSSSPDFLFPVSVATSSSPAFLFPVTLLFPKYTDYLSRRFWTLFLTSLVFISLQTFSSL